MKRWTTVGDYRDGGYPTHILLGDDGRPSGIFFRHCGHPTALFPYAVCRDGEPWLYVSCSGYAFRSVKAAKAAAEQILDGACDWEQYQTKHGPVRRLKAGEAVTRGWQPATGDGLLATASPEGRP